MAGRIGEIEKLKCVVRICERHRRQDNWSDMGPDADWHQTIGEEAWSTAFKPDCEVPLSGIPGLEHAGRAFPDTMHNFHIGWGQDLAASTICLLVKFRVFNHLSCSGKFDDKLAAAHELFMEFCTARTKTSGCDIFSKQAFDMKGTLSLHTCKQAKRNVC